MPTIKEYNVKIKSLRNTRKITKTMKMVSASKLRRAQDAQTNAKLYAENLTRLMNRISEAAQNATNPLLETPKNVSNVLILVITSDKGLCGAFNNNVNKRVLTWIQENKGQSRKIDFSFCGRKGYAFFRKNNTVNKYYEHVTNRPQFSDAKKIGDDLMQAFLSKQYDEIYIAYNQFFSPISQKTVLEKVLPINSDGLKIVQANQKKVATAEVKNRIREYLYEPKAPDLLAFLIPYFLYFKIFFSLLENSAGEHGARMASMDNATKNANELINTNVLYRNRARQAQITKELIEIISGAEALK